MKWSMKWLRSGLERIGGCCCIGGGEKRIGVDGVCGRDGIVATAEGECVNWNKGIFVLL